MSGPGSAEELGILQRHGQGCVELSRGLEYPNLPLSTLIGVQLAPTSPKLVEGRFSEVGLPPYCVLGSSAVEGSRKPVCTILHSPVRHRRPSGGRTAPLIVA